MNGYGYTREEQDKRIAEKIEYYRECASLFPTVKRVIEQFDGKVYNVKLERALQEATGTKRIHAEKRCNGSYFAIYYYKDYQRGSDLARMKAEKALSDGKRINAAAIIENMREMREDKLKTAAEIERNLCRVDEVKEQIETIRKAVNSLMDSLPWEIRDTYKLNAHLDCR